MARHVFFPYLSPITTSRAAAEFNKAANCSEMEKVLGMDKLALMNDEFEWQMIDKEDSLLSD